MQNTNHVILIGRLTKTVGEDARSFGYLQNGTPKAEFSIAVNGRGKKNPDGSYTEEVNYFDITLFGKTAESLKPYLTKGQQVAIDGYLKQDRWTDQQGNNKSKVHVIVNTIELLGGKREQNNSYNPQEPYQTAQEAQSAYAKQFQQQNGFPEDIPWQNQQENIPF